MTLYTKLRTSLLSLWHEQGVSSVYELNLGMPSVMGWYQTGKDVQQGQELTLNERGKGLVLVMVGCNVRGSMEREDRLVLMPSAEVAPLFRARCEQMLGTEKVAYVQDLSALAHGKVALVAVPAQPFRELVGDAFDAISFAAPVGDDGGDDDGGDDAEGDTGGGEDGHEDDGRDGGHDDDADGGDRSPSPSAPSPSAPSPSAPSHSPLPSPTPADNDGQLGIDFGDEMELTERIHQRVAPLMMRAAELHRTKTVQYRSSWSGEMKDGMYFSGHVTLALWAFVACGVLTCVIISNLSYDQMVGMTAFWHWFLMVPMAWWCVRRHQEGRRVRQELHAAMLTLAYACHQWREKRHLFCELEDAALVITNEDNRFDVLQEIYAVASEVNYQM